jgi:hypothetical protein
MLKYVLLSLCHTLLHTLKYMQLDMIYTILKATYSARLYLNMKFIAVCVRARH